MLAIGTFSSLYLRAKYRRFFNKNLTIICYRYYNSKAACAMVIDENSKYIASVAQCMQEVGFFLKTAMMLARLAS